MRSAMMACLLHGTSTAYKILRAVCAPAFTMFLLLLQAVCQERHPRQHKRLPAADLSTAGRHFSTAAGQVSTAG